MSAVININQCLQIIERYNCSAIILWRDLSALHVYYRTNSYMVKVVSRTWFEPWTSVLHFVVCELLLHQKCPLKRLFASGR